MKKIYKDKITNIANTPKFDNKFLFEYLEWKNSTAEVEVIFMSDLLEKRKNSQILEKVKQKSAMWSNVYSPEDELEIFKELFDTSLKNKKKIHIIGVTLGEEIEILEQYYKEL
jgi:hypothetical protein